MKREYTSVQSSQGFQAIGKRRKLRKMPSESSQKIHDGISSEIITSDCTYGTYDIVHTKDSQPSPSNGKREGLYWSGSKWYCEYCNANGDTFYMEVHDCNKSKMKNS